MKNLCLLVFFSSSVFAQTAMDDLRWFLRPQGQEVLISIDDLHDERLAASPEMDFGFESIAQQNIKKDVLIAVIDGGIEIDHPELKDFIAYNSADCYEGNIIPPMADGDRDNNGYKGDCAGWNFVDATNRAEDLDGHGTHVTGVMVSVLKALKGHVKFLPLRVFAPGEGTRSVKSDAPLSVRLTRAFEYALARKVDVIHMSVGWPKSFMSFELETVIKKAFDQGVIIVSAAGNSSQRATILPCQMEGVICVGALRADGNVARFSNWGSQVDIFAPGEKILSTIPHTLAPLHISRKGVDYKNGPSQAAPFVSAALAVLKGVYPEENREALYSRLMMTANSGAAEGGLKGLFHVDRALALSPASFVFPQLKGLHHVVMAENKFEVEVKFKSLWLPLSEATPVRFTCLEASITDEAQSLAVNATSLIFHGSLKQDSNELNCEVKLPNDAVPLKLKIQHPLKDAFETVKVHQDELLVVSTRSGGRSRFLTIDALKGNVPGPLYYISGGKNLVLYNKDQNIGAVPMNKDCSFLKIWQADFNHDGQNELMMESMCNKTHLEYRFMDLDYKAIYPTVRYRPALAVINYDDFDVITTPHEPPRMRFIYEGLGIPSTSAWESQITGKKQRLYEMFPTFDKEKNEWNYDVRILEEPKKWMKGLKLRTTPNYAVIFYYGNKLLVQVGARTVWVNIDTQEASFANYDDMLLKGSRRQSLISAPGENILQSFLTPYEYRGALLDKTRLRYLQLDKFDPLIDILGTQKNNLGYLTILRSFQSLIYVQYDHSGKMLSEKKSIVDRFDFLTAQDLISSVINLSLNERMIQIVDGTKINTNYIDVMTDGKKISYEIPDRCVTQQPIVINGLLTMPIFCAKTKTEFEMRFIEL
jgi:hypothetical protein